MNLIKLSPLSPPLPPSPPHLIKVLERLPVLGDLFLGETLGVANQDLVIRLIEGSADGGYHLSPAGPEGFHGVFAVRIVKDQSSLHCLERERTKTGEKWSHC